MLVNVVQRGQLWIWPPDHDPVLKPVVLGIPHDLRNLQLVDPLPAGCCKNWICRWSCCIAKACWNLPCTLVLMPGFFSGVWNGNDQGSWWAYKIRDTTHCDVYSHNVQYIYIYTIILYSIYIYNHCMCIYIYIFTGRKKNHGFGSDLGMIEPLPSITSFCWLLRRMWVATTQKPWFDRGIARPGYVKIAMENGDL